MSVEKSLELDVILEQVKAHCSFSLGQKLIEETRPSFNPLIIRRDHDRMKEALECVIRFGPMPFAGITDITKILENASKDRVLTAQELLDEMRFIRGVRGIMDYEKTLENDHPNLSDLLSTICIHDRTEKYLSGCINDYGDVMDSASIELRSIRRSLRSIDGEISSAINKFMASHSTSLVDSIVTYRNGRAVILVKASDKNTFGGIVYGDSASGQASYVEPASVVAVNNRKQELIAKEQDEIHRILLECSRRVSEIAEEEMANLQTVALLDALFAKAEWGKDHDAIAADLSEERHLELIKARHPLIDAKKVVSNDYHLMDPHRTLLITGPNTGGKTVSMKIIGLFTLMTYCGMPVTAEKAMIPFFDHVFVDIGDDQSVVSSLSSFSAQIVKLAEVINHATEKSLALLDEIGSGTDPKEGESLAIAILNELRKRGTMTVATTHYGRLKTYGKRHEDILLACVQFDMEKLSPTYKFIEGLTGQSNALEVAEKYGLPDEIVKYARFLKNQAKTDEDKMLERLEAQLNDNQLLQERLESALKETEETKKKLAHEQRQLDLEKEKLKDHAKVEAEEIVEEAKRKADEILKQMRSMQMSDKYHEVLKQRHDLEKIVTEETVDDDEHDDNRSFAKGDTVELKANGQLAEVLSINRKDITIRLNGREIKVRPAAIRHTMRHLAKKKPNEKSVHVYVEKPIETMPLECNLIGMHVDEALETLNRYMDRAKISGLRTYRIIHGDGTGALRKAVHKILSSDSSVKEFRLGMPSEGGTGATVVTMKG